MIFLVFFAKEQITKKYFPDVPDQKEIETLNLKWGQSKTGESAGVNESG